MKLFNKLMAATLILGMAACSSDDNGGGQAPEKPGSNDVIYSSIAFRMPKKKSPARSTEKEGEEAGQTYENNVGSILVVLATKDTDNSYKFVTYALNDAPLTDAASSKHTIVFQDKEALYNLAGETGDGETVYVFAYCNPTLELRTKVAGTLNATSGVYEGGMSTGDTFTDLICDTNIENSWSKNGFLMTSIGEATGVHSVTMPSKATLQTYNNPGNAFPLGTVEVIRTACRFDFRDAAPEAATKPLTYTVYNEDVTPKVAVADVKLTRVAMFNLRNEFYYLPRTKATADAADITLCPTFDGMEDGFVISPDATTITENLPEVIDPLNPTTSLKWVSLEAVLGLDEDSDDGWGESVTPATDKEGYHIWRYATENTTVPGADPTAAATTGYVFESEIIAPEDFGNIGENGEKLVMYLYNNKLYPSAMAIAKEIENVPVSTLATAFENAFTLTKDATGKVTAAEPKSDEIVENMGFTAYKPNTEGKYLAYYFAFNKHNDDEDVTTYGDMEFATVRNNVYKLAVTSVKKFGTFKPNENVEEWDTYFTLDVKVRNWVVRINNLEF